MKTRTKYLLDSKKPFRSGKCTKCEEDEYNNREEFIRIIAEYTKKCVAITEQMADEDVRRESKEMKLLFSELNIKFSQLPTKFQYLAVIRKFIQRRGIKVSHIVRCLQAKFNNHYRMEWTSPYSFINRLAMDYDHYILGIPEPKPFLNI